MIGMPAWAIMPFSYADSSDDHVVPGHHDWGWRISGRRAGNNSWRNEERREGRPHGRLCEVMNVGTVEDGLGSARRKG